MTSYARVVKHCFNPFVFWFSEHAITPVLQNIPDHLMHSKAANATTKSPSAHRRVEVIVENVLLIAHQDEIDQLRQERKKRGKVTQTLNEVLQI